MHRRGVSIAPKFAAVFRFLLFGLMGITATSSGKATDRRKKQT
jgi:hypothetical protein